MSKYNDNLKLNSSLEDAKRICKHAILQLGWNVLEESSNSISCKEETPNLTSFTFAAKIKLLLIAHQNSVTIEIQGSILGFGPIQAGHLKGQIGKLKNAVEVKFQSAQSNNHPKPTVSLADEITKLSELRNSGIISEIEFQKAKDNLIK